MVELTLRALSNPEEGLPSRRFEVEGVCSGQIEAVRMQTPEGTIDESLRVIFEPPSDLKPVERILVDGSVITDVKEGEPQAAYAIMRKTEGADLIDYDIAKLAAVKGVKQAISNHRKDVLQGYALTPLGLIQRFKRSRQPDLKFPTIHNPLPVMNRN